MGRVQEDIAKIDSSLFDMQLMLVNRTHGYDTNPIAGFEDDQLTKALEAKEEGMNPSGQVWTKLHFGDNRLSVQQQKCHVEV